MSSTLFVLYPMYHTHASHYNTNQVMWTNKEGKNAIIFSYNIYNRHCNSHSLSETRDYVSPIMQLADYVLCRTLRSCETVQG